VRAIRKQLTYSNLMSTAAVFIALGLGSAYAAERIGSKDIARNAVKSPHVKNRGVKTQDLDRGAVKVSKLASDAVNTRKVADGSLLSADFAPGQLPQGERGPRGVPGENATRLFAHVSGPGNLVYGSGVSDVDKTSDNMSSRYEVTFDRDVSACVPLTNAGVHSDHFTASSPQINTIVWVKPPNTVDVITWSPQGAGYHNSAFFVAVFCP
jgi:hypothetical protein